MFANLSVSLEVVDTRPGVTTSCPSCAPFPFHEIRDPSEGQPNPKRKETNYDAGREGGL